MVEFAVSRPGFRISLRVETMPPCAVHGATPCSCARPRSLVYENPNDTPCVAMLETIGMSSYFKSAVATTWTGTLIAMGSVAVGTIQGAPVDEVFVVAGTVSSPTPTFQDWQLNAQVPGTSGSVIPTVQPFTTAQPSAGTVVQVVGNIVNGTGGTVTYNEAGLAMAFTVYPAALSTPLLLTHDTFTGTVVPPLGVLIVTYDFSIC